MRTSWTRSTITLELAEALVATVIAEAAETGKAFAVAIVDDGGELKAYERMDGARASSGNTAIDKAYTATSGRPTHLWHEVLKKDEVLGAGARGAIGRLVTLGGGFPIVVEGNIVGAIGVAGGHYSEDIKLVTAALVKAGVKSEW